MSAIAIELGIGRTSIANYRAELSQAEPHVIAKMAADLGENEAAWLALVESERARKAADRKAWARVARQLGAAAMVAAVALTALPMHAADSLNNIQTRHYAKWRRLARFLRVTAFRMSPNAHGTPALLA